MTSRTQLLDLVKSLKWKDVAAALRAQPELIAFTDKRGRNLLHLCCGVHVAKKGLKAASSTRTCDALLEAGLDLNREAFSEGSWKATPLWYAVSRGENRALARHLLERGADPDHCLWAAAFRDDVATIRLLLDHGAPIDAVAEDETPFLSAVKTSHFLAAEELLKRGADVNFRDSRGMTALHYMLKKDSDKRHFRMVLRFEPRGDIPNAEGKTAAELMSKKRDEDFRAMARELAKS
jgi:ankyrin repeat protein